MAHTVDLYGIANTWDCPHTERHLSLCPGVALLDLRLSLPHDINSFTFSKYLRQHVRDRQMGLTKAPIRLPFLAKQTAQDNTESVEVFKLILQYMLETSLGEEKRRLLGSYIVQKGLSHEALRDEIYVQLCNQTMGDPKRHGGAPMLKAWELLAICLSAFPPSHELAKFLLKYVSDSANTAEYNVVCQQKLLQCFSADMSQCRVYPPTLLECEAARRKACMALSANFPDGEKVFGHIESWTTGEQFASHLLRNRHFAERATGWTVTLRDDRDIYECAGYDIVLDLIAEMEVPPSFPCGLAYLLTTSGMSKSPRQHYTDQPHTAERPRLMPLEVDELPESLMVPGGAPRLIIPPPPPPEIRSPVVQSPVALSPAPPTPRAPTPRAPTPRPPTPVVVKSEDLYVYASRDEALSQTSALNKRKEPVPEELSRTSALNNRYAPLPVRVEEPVIERPVEIRQPPKTSYPRPVSQPIQQRAYKPPPRQMKKDPLKLRGAVGMGQGEADDLDFVVDSLFVDIDEEVKDLSDPFSMEGRIMGGGDNLPQTQAAQPPMQFGLGVPQFSILGSPTSFFPPPPPPLLDPSSLQAQIYYQQMQQQQQRHTAELQSQLVTKQLENQVLQSALQTEMLKQQLQQIQGSSQTTTNQAPPPQAAANQAPAAPPITNGTAAVGAAPHWSAQKKQATPPSVKPKTVTIAKTPPVQLTLNIQPPPAPPVPTSSTVAQPPETANKPGQPAPNGPAALDPPPAPPVILTGGAAKPEPEVVKATPAGGMYRQPPKKIGQIKWPPTPEKTEEVVVQKVTPGKILIDERTEEKDVIVPKQSAEETQRKINEKIRQAKENANMSEERSRPKPKTPYVPKPPPPPAAVPAPPPAVKQFTQTKEDEKSDDGSSQDGGLKHDASTGTVDMQTLRITLAKQLEAVEWGTEKPREPSAKKKAAILVPPPPPPPLRQQSTSPEPVLIPRVEVPLPPPPKMDAERPFDIHAMDGIHTALYAQIAEPFYTYVRVPWTFDIRKEVFSPLEKLENSSLVHVVFVQIVLDVFSNDCIRFSKEERRSLSALLDANGIHQRNVGSHLHNFDTKTRIIEAAKDTPCYFSRLYPVNGGSRHRNLHLVGVSHSGVRLISRCKDINDDRLSVIEHVKFDEILELYMAKPSTAVIRLAKRSIVLYSYLAPGIVHFIKTYQAEAEKAFWHHNEKL